VHAGRAKPGFVVADVLLRGVVEAEAVEAFVGKYDLAARPAGVGPRPRLVAGAAALEAPHRLGWKDRDALRANTGQARSAAISKIMDEHYFRHPLARAARSGTAALPEHAAPPVSGPSEGQL